MSDNSSVTAKSYRGRREAISNMSERNKCRRSIETRTMPRKGESRNLDLKASLARLPASFCWSVLDILRDALRNEITTEFYETLTGISRSRDVRRYIELDQLYGLQCMNRWARPFPGNPAAVRLLISVIRKYPSLETYTAKQRKARCLESVRALDAALPVRRWDGDVYTEMKAVLAKVLGSVPSSDVIADACRHGPGSTTTLGYKTRSAYFKFADWPYPCCPRAATLLEEVIRKDQRWVGVLEDSYRRRYKIPHWAILNQDTFWRNVIDAQYSFNRITSVPKDGQKDRPIAIEPTGNMYLQLGVGRILRTLLRSQGIDLDHQQEVNRRLAIQASIDARLFTIDLSNASDTISRAFVQAVLPPDWFALLDSLRSPFGELPSGEALHYAKFSSMGNGFTFELETLLFLALGKAISNVYGHRTDTCVCFGDDIVGEAYLYRHFSIYLDYSGFQVNEAKSFSSGTVRESCGVDALDGVDIRPVFIKKVPENMMDILGIRNRLRRWALRHIGVELPELDDFLITYLRGPFLVGPDSDTEYDTYWHAGDWPQGRSFSSLSRRVAEIPAKDLGFRKLMHTLRSCSGEGGNFLVSQPSERRASIVSRIVM